MRFFLFSLFLLLLFDSFQGSTLPSKRNLGELNTTLKTNVDGTYQRINPCTNKEDQSTSCVGSHEFSHHVSGENWSEYSQKCSAIIKSFLHAIGNLVRFDSTPKGTFNFHINTSITHKDGHCDSKESQSGRPIPTIIIEATGCEVPPPSCDSPAEEDKNTQINTSQQSTKGQQNSDELITRNPNLTSQGENTSSNEETKTTQEVTEIIEIPAQDRTPKSQGGRVQGKKSRTPENVTPTGTVQMVLPVALLRPTMETTKSETSTETFTEISKVEQNSDMYGPPKRPTTQPSINYVTNPLTVLPEDKFTSPAPSPPKTINLGNPSGFAPNIPAERGFVPQRIPQPTTVNYMDQFIPNQPAPVGMEQPPNDNSRQLFSDELGQAPVNQQSANSFPSPDQIPLTNLPSTNAFRDETQLERPFAYPVASSLVEPQPVELPFSKPPLPPRAPAAGPPAPNHPEHFPNQLRTTTAFPPTIVKPEFDELPGQGLVTRPPLTKNNFFNGPGKPFPHDQRPELPTPLPPTRTPVFKTDYDANESSQGLTKQTLPINQPVHPDDVAFVPKDSSNISVVNNRNQPNRPPFTPPEPQFKPLIQFPPTIRPQQQTGHFNNIQPPRTTTPETSTTAAPSSFDYDYQYPNYEAVDYDYPAQQSPNSTSEHPQNPQNPRQFVHRQFHPRAPAPFRPRIFHGNHPTSRISQPHQQFMTETVDMNRFPTNTLPKPAFGPKFRERPGISYPLNPFEQLATPKIQTPPPQLTASPQTPPESFPQPTANLDIPQPQPTLPYEDKLLTTPAPELSSSVEKTTNKDSLTTNSGYINPRIPAPFTPPEPQLEPPMQFPPTTTPQPPLTTTPDTTAAPELTSSFDYDYIQYPNYEAVDYDYPAQQPPNSTSEHPQNPKQFVHQQFHPRVRAPFRKIPQNFFPRQHPMRNPQMQHHPHIKKHKNNLKFINTTMPEYQPEYYYEYMDGVAPEQMPDYDYVDYQQFPINAPQTTRKFGGNRQFYPNFYHQRHQMKNLRREPFHPHLGKSFQAGIPTSVGLNPVIQHNNRNNGRQNSHFINPSNIQEPETQFTAGIPPSATLPPEELQTVQPGITTTAYENKTLTTESPTTAEPEYQPPLEPVHQTVEGTQQVLDRGEQQAPNSNQPELQAPVDHTFPPQQPPMRNFETPQPQLMARKFKNETISTDFQTTIGPNYQLNSQNQQPIRWVGQMPNSYTIIPGQRVPNGFFHPGQPFRGGAPFHRGFPPHQQPIRNFRPVFTPETPKNKSQFQSTEKHEFDNQLINRRIPGQVSNFAGQVPNTFNQPQPQLRGNAFAVPPVGLAPSTGEHPHRNLEVDSSIPLTPENESRATVQPEFQPQQDNQVTKDNEKIPESHFTEGHVQDTFHQDESPEKDNEPIFPVEQHMHFATNQPAFISYENETVTTDIQTTVRPEYQPPAEPINQHTDGKQILPSPVSDFRGHQAQNLGQPELRDNRRPGQIFPLKQQPMNFKVPQSRHISEEKTIPRDFQRVNQHRLQPHVEHDNRHIGNRWTGQRPNFQFRGQQVPNIFPQSGQQFRSGPAFPPPFSVEPHPMRILEDAQPQFTTTAYEDVTTAAPEHQSSLEPQQSTNIEQQSQETQNLGPESDSEITKSPSGELPSASFSKQDQEGNFQISQPRPISGRTNEEGTFTTAPQPSLQNVNDRAVSDFGQQNQNNFDQSRLNGNAPSRQFPPNIPLHQSMDSSRILQPNPPAQPTQKFQAPSQYNRGMPNFAFRNPQIPRPFLQPHFHLHPNPPFHPNFFPQQNLMRNIPMGPPRRTYKNETVMTEFQETKPKTQNYGNDFTNDRRPDLPNHFINQQNPNTNGHFRRFPSGMHQVDRHDGPPFVKRPPMEFPPSRGLGRIPESVPGPFSANRFVNPPNNNQPATNRNNFQPETALMHSDRNLDYDTPTSFYNSKPTPNENQPEPQPDLIPGVGTSDEYLSATSSDETNTTSPPLPNTSVDYEDEENVPSVLSPYPGQVLNDNVTTPKSNTSALYSEQITPIISSPRWQPPADISTSEYKNSLYSQPPLTRPKPLEVISTSESTKQAFGGDQPPVIPVRKEFPFDFNASPDGTPAHVEDTADIHEKPTEGNNSVSQPQSNSFVSRDSTNAFSFEHQNEQFLNTPDNRPLVILGTTPPSHHIDTTTTTIEQVTSESHRNGNIPLKSLTNPQPISVGGPHKFSPKTLSSAAHFIPSNQLPKNPITNQPHPLALGPPSHPIPSSQPIVPIYQQQHSQPRNLYRAQTRPERNFNSEEQQMTKLSQPLKKPEVPQQLSGIPMQNRQSVSTQSIEIQRIASEQPKWDASRTTAFPPRSQLPLSQPNRQNFNSANSFVSLPPVNQHTNAIRLNQQFPIQSSSDVARPQADSFIQTGSEVEHQSVISAKDQHSPVDFNVQKTPFKPIPAASPQLPKSSTLEKTTPKTSKQQQFDTSKSPQTSSPKLTNVTHEEVTTTTDYPQPFTGIPVQLLKPPVNPPTGFPDTPIQIGNPEFVHSELPPPVTEATSSQVQPPFDEINPTSQTNFESHYVHDKISTNSPPPVAEPQPQPSFAYTTIQNYKTTERPVLKPKTIAIVSPHNQKDFTNLNIPPSTLPHPDQHYTAATSLKTSETAYNPIAPLHEKHDKQAAQDSLEFIDNSPQIQPTTAVKYPEKIETAEYEPSPIPRPQPQTALNNSGRQTEDNSANVWADQQQQITSSSEFGVTPPMSYDRLPPRNLKNINTQSQSPPQYTGIDSQNHYTAPQTHKTTETYEQEIFTTDNSHRQTPQSVLILGEKVSPKTNPIHTALPQSITHETALNSNQQISAATEGGHATSHADPLVLPLTQEHSNSETKKEVIVIEKTTVPPPKQLVTKIPNTLASIEHKSVTLVRAPPRKTKIVEEIVTTELPEHIANSPPTTQLAFAEKLLNYEDKKLSKLQHVTTSSPTVENKFSTTPPAGSSSYSEQISNRQIVYSGNAFPKNFERDNEQLEGSSPPNHVSTSTPQRPQQVILDNPTSSFDDYDQQHSTRSPDMFPEYDEIPPNFNSRTSLTKGHPNEKSHVTFPMQPSAALSANSRWTTPMPNDFLASKPRNDIRQPTQVTAATPQPGFLPSISTPSNTQDHPTTERFTSFTRPDKSLVRSM